MKKLFVLLIVLALAGPALGATKFEIDPDNPYVLGGINDCNGSVCYGLRNEATKTLHRWDTNFTHTASNAALGAGESFRDVYATSNNAVAFAVVKNSDAKNALYRTADYGDTLTKVLELGQEGATWIVDVWSMPRSFAEVTIGGNTVFLIGEYNVNDSRTPGGTNDKVRIMQSTDGISWTELVKWNTSGHQIRHIHAIRQDAATGYIYITTGDTDAESAIIRWDPSVGVWADNLTPTALATRDGFKCAHNAQRYRTCDIIITTNYIHYFADTAGSVTNESGIWRAAKDLTSFSRVNTDIEGTPAQYGWTGAISESGKIIFGSGINPPASDAQGGIWCSSDDGATYQKIGLMGYNLNTTGYSNINSFSGKIVVGTGSGAGKESFDTAVIYDTGITFAEEYPIIFHPVYFSGPSGVDNTDTGRGWLQSLPYRTGQYALISSRMTPGARLVMSAGSSPYSNGIAVTHGSNARPGTGMLVIEGAGQGLTNYYSDVDSVTSYAISFGLYDSQSYLLRNFSLYSIQTTKAFDVLAGGGGGVSGVGIKLRNMEIGHINVSDVDGLTVTVYQADIDIKNSILWGSTGKINLGFGAASGSLIARNTRFLRGSHGIYNVEVTGRPMILTGCVFWGYSFIGIRYSTGNLSLLKNTIFQGDSTPPIAAMYDHGDDAENDSYVDYNIFFGNAQNTVGVANVGGSHSLTTDPLFVSASSGNLRIPRNSPAYNAGTFITGLHDAAGAKDGFGTVLQPRTGKYIFNQTPAIGAHQPKVLRDADGMGGTYTKTWTIP